MRRTIVTRAVVAVTAVAASAFVGTQAVAADGEESSDGTTDTTAAEESDPTPETTIPTTPVTTTPTPIVTTTPAPTLPTPSATSEEPDDEEVEPFYGFQKFRVGVKAGSGDPDAVKGSTFKIVVSDGDGFPGGTFDCKVGAPGSDGVAWCDGQDTPLLRRASSVGVTPTSDIPESQGIIAPPGSTVTVTQTSAPRLQRTTTPGVLEPCEANPDLAPAPFCGSVSGDTLELDGSSILFVNDRRSGTGSGVSGSDTGTDASAASSTASLPDTGASEGVTPTHLALGAMMLAGGGYLLTRGRRPVDAGR